MRSSRLAQLAEETFITDGGMETTLIFEAGFELPHFAAFPLLDSGEGVAALRAYYEPYVRIAQEEAVGLLLDTPTWRASRDWGAALGYSESDLASINRRAVDLLEEVRASMEPEQTMLISGCVGPRGDAYRADEVMSETAAEEYHAPQIATLAETSVDLVSALTLTNVSEAVGIARAAENAGIAAVVSFTVETDGRLPSGQALGEAIEEVDSKTLSSVAYFMINCAHPTHFASVLEQGDAWRERIRGVRANASTKSHAELDESEVLDSGDPDELAARYLELATLLPRMNVLGGCCGTDERHVRAISSAWKGGEGGSGRSDGDG